MENIKRADVNQEKKSDMRNNEKKAMKKDAGAKLVATKTPIT